MKSKSLLTIGVRLLFASLALLLFRVYDPVFAFALAGVIMAFPSFKRLSGRLAIGEQDDEGDEELKAIQKIGEQVQRFNTTVEELREDIATIKDGTGGSGNQRPRQVVKQSDLKGFIDKVFGDNGRKGSDKASFEISANVMKAAETFGIPTVFNGGAGTDASAFTGRTVDPTLYQASRKRNLILDHFPIEMVTTPKLVYLEKKEVAGSGDSGSNTSVGGADWIGSGEAKPKRSFRVTTGEVEAKKLAIFGTIEDKLLRDVPSFENWIREDFMDELRETFNDGLLNNDPELDPKAPLGLKTNAVLFEASTAFYETISDPNYVDMIIAAGACMAERKEQPAKAFVSSDVYFRIFNLKDGDGRYLHKDLVYNPTTRQLFAGGIEIVAADSEDVPATHLLMISANPGFKVKSYGNIVFERGLNGEDFREDKTSYRAYWEVLSFVPEHRENSVMYDTWANIEAAITAPNS